MNYFYFDASALGKRYAAEAGTPLVNHLFETVEKSRLTALSIGVGELLSIIVRRHNSGTLDEQTFQQASTELRREVIQAADFTLQSIPETLVLASLPLIEKHSLNATDALVLASALGMASALRRADSDIVLVASDMRLLRAAGNEGLATLNPETDNRSEFDALIAG